MAPKKDPNSKLVAENRKARYNYAVEDTAEAGMMLTGSEVKSLRTGQSNIAESYVSYEDDEMWLINAYIPEYGHAKTFGHEARRRRKLLLKAKEIARFAMAVAREGMTIVPLKLYFNEKGRAKLLIGVAKGKKQHDKRETEKKRDWARQKTRLMKDHG